MISNISSRSNSPKSERSYPVEQAKDHYSPESNPETQDSSFVSEFIPTVFEWKGEGTSVFITGSFCNWKQKFKMIKLESTFQLIIDLPKGVYQYKFIVDSEWKYSIYHPVVLENGIINNIIDNSPINTSRQNTSMNSSTCNSVNNSTNFTIFDLKSPVPCPFIYKNEVILRKTKPFQPAMTNHVFFSRKYLTDTKNYFVYLSTQRVRMKVVNIIYYKPTRSTF